MSIRPKELVRHVVDGESIGPSQPLFVGDDASEIASVHAQPADVGLQMPGGEKQVSGSWMDNDGPGIRNAIRLERLPVSAVQFRHFHMFRMPIQPVQLATDPIDGQTFQAHGIVFDDRLLGAGPVDKRPVNGLGVDVGKVETVLPEVEIDGHDVAEVLMDDGVLFSIDRHVADVKLVGENQPGRDRVFPLASVLVRLTLVVRLVTLAIVGAGRVDAVLGTNSRGVGTFVHIRAGFAVGHEPVARIAGALVLDGGVDAELAALMDLNLETLVDSAQVRLVAVIRTVGNFVADQTFVDALAAVGAFELPVRTGGHWSASAFASAVGAVPLVRPVAAIVLLVAVIRFGHALGVLASEFRRRAGAVLAVAFGPFVRSVSAIVVVIARPVAVDAAAVAARELLRRAAIARGAVERSRVLVGSVDTVRIAIANPFARNTLSFACGGRKNSGIS